MNADSPLPPSRPRTARAGACSLLPFVLAFGVSFPSVQAAEAEAAETAASATASAMPPHARLTLEECRRLALSNNLVLRAQRESLIAAGHLLRAEYGAFEPELVSTVERENNERENTIEQTISQGTAFFREDNTLFSVGVEGVSATGARYRAGWTERDINNNLRIRATDPFRREFQGFLGLTLTQPLLKDFGFNATLARLRLARADEKLARQDYRRQMMLVLGSTETAYWDLYIAQERLRLREESVAVAEQLLAGNRDRVREGKMAEIELVEAEAGLAQRRSLATEARQRLIDASGRLRTLFAEPVDAANWMVVAADPLPEPATLTPVEQAVADAFAQHPEYLARLHRVDQEKVRVAYARNQRWPQIDLKASFGKNGLGPNLDGAWGDIMDRSYDSWSVGLEMRIPLLSGVRRANELGAAHAKRREALLQLKAAEIEIANNLFAAQRKVDGLREVMSNYDEVVGAGRRLLDNENARLDEGRSDSRRLLEVETQYADAQVAALESRGEYEKARIEFELSGGRILTARGLDLPSDLPRADPFPKLGEPHDGEY